MVNLSVVSMAMNSRLYITIAQYRAAAFDVTGRKTSATVSVIFRFTHKTARQESSKFYSDLRKCKQLGTYQVLLYQLSL